MVSIGLIGKALSGFADSVERQREMELKRKESENRTKFLQAQLDQSAERTLQFQVQSAEARVQAKQRSLQRIIEGGGRFSPERQQAEDELLAAEAALSNVLSATGGINVRAKTQAQTDFSQDPSSLLAPQRQAPQRQAPSGLPPTRQPRTRQAEALRGQAPQERTPQEQTPVGQTPVGQTPVGQTPVGQTPVGQAPEGLPSEDDARTPGFTPRTLEEENMVSEVLSRFGVREDQFTRDSRGNPIIQVADEDSQQILQEQLRRQGIPIPVVPLQISPRGEDAALLERSSIVESVFQNNLTGTLQVEFGQNQETGDLDIQFIDTVVEKQQVPDPEDPESTVSREVPVKRRVTPDQLALFMSQNPSTMSAMAQSITDVAAAVDDPSARASFARFVQNKIAPSLQRALTEFESDGVVERMSDDRFAINPFKDQVAPQRVQAAQDLMVAISSVTSGLPEPQRALFKFLPRAANEEELVGFFMDEIQEPLKRLDLGGPQRQFLGFAGEGANLDRDRVLSNLRRVTDLLPEELDEPAARKLLRFLVDDDPIKETPTAARRFVEFLFGGPDRRPPIVTLATLGGETKDRAAVIELGELLNSIQSPKLKPLKQAVFTELIKGLRE